MSFVFSVSNGFLIGPYIHLISQTPTGDEKWKVVVTKGIAVSPSKLPSQAVNQPLLSRGSHRAKNQMRKQLGDEVLFCSSVQPLMALTVTS